MENSDIRCPSRLAGSSKSPMTSAIHSQGMLFHKAISVAESMTSRRSASDESRHSSRKYESQLKPPSQLEELACRGFDVYWKS